MKMPFRYPDNGERRVWPRARKKKTTVANGFFIFIIITYLNRLQPGLWTKAIFVNDSSPY